MSDQNMDTPTAAGDDGGRQINDTPVSVDTPTLMKQEGRPTPMTPAEGTTPTLMKRDSEISGTGEGEQLEDTVFDVQLSEVNFVY